jgi:hypothetical protein
MCICYAFYSDVSVHYNELLLACLLICLLAYLLTVLLLKTPVTSHAKDFVLSYLRIFSLFFYLTHRSSLLAILSISCFCLSLSSLLFLQLICLSLFSLVLAIDLLNLFVCLFLLFISPSAMFLLPFIFKGTHFEVLTLIPAGILKLVGASLKSTQLQIAL